MSLLCQAVFKTIPKQDLSNIDLGCFLITTTKQATLARNTLNIMKDSFTAEKKLFPRIVRNRLISVQLIDGPDWIPNVLPNYQAALLPPGWSEIKKSKSELSVNADQNLTSPPCVIS